MESLCFITSVTDWDRFVCFTGQCWLAEVMVGFIVECWLVKVCFTGMSVDWVRCVLLAWVLIGQSVLYRPECWLLEVCFTGLSVDCLRCVLLAWVLIAWGVFYWPECWLAEVCSSSLSVLRCVLLAWVSIGWAVFYWPECWLIEVCFTCPSVDWLSLLVLKDCFLLFQRENQRLEMQRAAEEPSVWVASSSSFFVSPFSSVFLVSPLD